MGNQFLHKLEEKWQVQSKIYIALKASILQAFEDENIEDIKRHIITGMWRDVCSETDLVDVLKKNPQILHGSRLKMGENNAINEFFFYKCGYIIIPENIQKISRKKKKKSIFFWELSALFPNF